MEDKDRFGTPIEPLKASALPSVRVEPATAQSISAVEPEPAVTERMAPGQTKPRAISFPEQAPTRPPESAPGAPTRIPFHLPPNGMGASASERVPASSGAPIPMVREAASTSPTSSIASSTKIALSLQTVMRNLPAFQLNGTPEAIPADVRIDFPFSLVGPQLAGGRIAVEARVFQEALPAPYRDFFIIDSSETPVLLPLQEVLKNLPDNALQMRVDQEEIQLGQSFETPFSIKAKEDQERLSATATPNLTESPAPVQSAIGIVEDQNANAGSVAKIELSGVESTDALAKWMEAGAKKPADQPSEIARQDRTTSGPAAELAKKKVEASEPGPSLDIKGRKEKNEAKEVVMQVNNLPGVAGCCLTFADGLGLAGNLPPEVAADGLCAMAPSLLQRIEKHMFDTKLGSLTAVTLHCTNSPLTFFMKGSICLTVLHAQGNLPAETQTKLAQMAKDLSCTYSQPETAHVDH
jgi:predicted regulator of Ras-like GTPase activity (Roadblock/LC7/MglB family)